MDIIELKDRTFSYSYKGGLKTSMYSELIAIESDRPFILLVFKEECVLVRVSMCSIENRLQSRFVRISRQVIVNMSLASEFLFNDGSYWVYLPDDKKYKVSKRREKSVEVAFLLYT